MEVLKITSTPNYSLFMDIIEEAQEIFLHTPPTDETLAKLELFILNRIKAEIEKGTFIERALTSENRWMRFYGIRTKRNEEDPTAIKVIPQWILDEEDN